MSLISRLFRSAPDPREGLRPLWHRIVALSREPEWYAECGVADSVAGRFDMISTVLALVLLRLERAPTCKLTAMRWLRKAGSGRTSCRLAPSRARTCR